MNLDEAISAHVAWKTKLRSAINGQEAVDPKALSTDHACALGKWIHGDGSKYASQPAFVTARSAHQKFHVVAGSIAGKVQAGRKDEATRMLDGAEYGGASQAVVQALMALRKVIDGK